MGAAACQGWRIGRARPHCSCRSPVRAPRPSAAGHRAGPECPPGAHGRAGRHLAMAGGPNPDQLLDLPVSWIAKGPGGWPGWCLLLAGSHALLPSLTPHGADQNVIQVTSWPVWPERVSRGETPPPHLPSTGPRSITRRSISGADPQPEGEIPHRTGSKCRRTLRTPLLHVRRRWS